MSETTDKIKATVKSKSFWGMLLSAVGGILAGNGGVIDLLAVFNTLFN
ncbi:hypothetical protein FACS1894186_4230 [Alphaproteobacteria bacterium]|nr:hypothetical protein FACS1894186_4230 [Alphaproteobacteria bacterium]